MSLPTVKLGEAFRNNGGNSVSLSSKHSQALVVLLLLVQVSALLYWRLMYGYSPIEKFADWTDIAPSWVHALAELQWLIRIVQLGAFALLAYIEYANQGLSKWLRAVMSSSSLHAVVICLSGLLLFSYFFQPGNIGTGDAYGNIGSAWVIRQSWDEGWWFVFWSNYGHLGGPALQFHNSAYYYFVAAISYVVADFQTANEVALFILFMLSACFMYLFVRQITGSRTSALVGTIAWSASYHQYHLSIALARLPASMVLSLLPLQFYLAERMLQSQKVSWRLWASSALTVGLIIWTHSLYGNMALGLGLVYVLVRALLIGAKGNWRDTIFRVLVAGSSYAASILVGSYQIVPTIADWGLLSLSGGSGSSSTIPPVSGLMWSQVLQRGSWDGGFIGNSLFVFAILGAIASASVRFWKALPLVSQLGLLLLLQFDPGPKWIATLLGVVPLGASLYHIMYYRPEMYLMFLVVTLAALTGVFTHLAAVTVRAWLKSVDAVWHRWLNLGFMSERIGLAIIVVIASELVPITIETNQKYPDTYFEGTPELGMLLKRLPDSEDKTSRIIHLKSSSNSSFMLPLLTGHPSLFGHSQDAPSTASTLTEIITLINSDVADRQLSPQTAALLYQTNTGYIITDSSVERFDGLEKIAATDYSILWRVPESSPIVELTSAQKPMLPPNDRIEVIQHDETNNTVHIEFYLPSEAYVQLAYTAYPYQRVILDGQRISVTPTRLGLIGFQAQSGRHVVEIAPELSPLRQWALAISAATSLLLLAVVLVPSRKKQL